MWQSVYFKIDFIYPRTGPQGWTIWTGPATTVPSASPSVSRRRRRPIWTWQAQFSCSGLQIRTVQWMYTVSTVGKAKLLNHQEAVLAAHCCMNARLFVLTSAGSPWNVQVNNRQLISSLSYEEVVDKSVRSGIRGRFGWSCPASFHLNHHCTVTNTENSKFGEDWIRDVD